MMIDLIANFHIIKLKIDFYICCNSLDIVCKTWSKNSFGLYNYHNADSDMIKNVQTITGRDTKLLRHEKAIDSDSPRVPRSRQKNKKIIVTLTAKDSDIIEDMDSETMDLSKKE